MKKFSFLVCLLVVMFLITGCRSNKTFTYQVSTGDMVKVKLDTSGDYNLKSELPFKILKGDKKLSQGTFVTIGGYNQYVKIAKGGNGAVVLDSGVKNGMEYLFYSYNDSNFNYIIKVSSKTGVLLENSVSKESAEECFNRINLTIE